MTLRILIVLLILAVPLELPGCGPFIPAALFRIADAPESPDDFARGQLGILQPSYSLKYQVIAYRYLAGIGLSKEEWSSISEAQDQPDLTDDMAEWMSARDSAAQSSGPPIDAYRQVQRQGYFETYRNCNGDAFRTAAATLKRIPQADAAEWIAAQDIVFSNCSAGSNIPPPAPDPRLAADRAYQIASAKFYSEQYDAARQDFQSIAADPSSPWHAIAPYLAGRCLVRAGKFDQAETAFRAVIADPARAQWRPAAQRMLGFAGLRAHPAERMHELALQLVSPHSEATIGQDLIDYRAAWGGGGKLEPKDDLTAWIDAFQHGVAATETWRTHRDLPWLVAALAAAKPNDTAVPELLAAAAAVQPDSPGYLTVSDQRLRLMPPDDARAFADQLLAGDLSASSRNEIDSRRLRLARDFDDFLRYAPRIPVAVEDYEVRPAITAEQYLDRDSTDILNLDLPLAYLQKAAASSLLPDTVRDQLQRVVFVRALLLSAVPPFDQVFELLHFPGRKAQVAPGYWRYTRDEAALDPYRDNWWCSQNAADQPPPKPRDPVPFLSAADRQKAAAEAAKLRSVATGPDWLAAQTLAFARQHPQDPRVPEALHFAVRATRFGCTDDQTGPLSKRAFDLLHQRYPSSAWTAQTPYWFK